MDFTNKNIVITGAGAGVGKKTAEKFLEHGGRVMICDRDEKVAEAAVRELSVKGKVVPFVADVCDYEAVRAMAKKAIETFGGVDIWLNNAGGAAFKKFMDTEPKDWDRDIRFNLVGVLNGCKAILPHFIEKKAGKIVNTVSDAGRVGDAGFAVYSAAKAGVIGFTKALAKEVGRYNILVNCVSLAATRTEISKKILDAMPPERLKKIEDGYALGRLGTMEDAANVLLLMSSDYVTWVTGQTLSSSGGYSFVS